MTWKVEGFIPWFETWCRSFDPSTQLQLSVLEGMDRIATNPHAALREAEFFWLALPGCRATDGSWVVIAWEIFTTSGRFASVRSIKRPNRSSSTSTTMSANQTETRTGDKPARRPIDPALPG